MQNNIDPLDLLKKAKKRLSVQAENDPLPLKEEEAESLCQGQPFSLPGKEGNDKIYFSIFALVDNVDKTQYPLFFFDADIQEKEEKILLKRRNEHVFFNPILAEALSGIGADIHGIGREDDLVSYKLSLESTVALKDPSKRFSIESLLSFHTEKEFLYAMTYLDLKDLLNPAKRPLCSQGLFSKVQESEDKGNVVENSHDILHDEYDRLIHRLEQNGSCKITYVDVENLVSLVKYALLSLAKQGKNVAIIAEKEDLKEIENYLRTPQFLPLSFRLQDLNFGEDLPKEFDLKNIPEYHCEEASSFLKARDDYSRLEKKKQDDFALLKKMLFSLPRPFLSNILSTPRKILPLDIADYTQENFEADTAFLKVFSSFSFLPNLKQEERHYKGMTANGSQESYDKLHFLLNRLIKELSAFMTRLLETNMRTFAGKSISTFRQFEEFGKSVRLLGGYNGFPKKYFDIIRDGEDLQELKKLYQKVSSSGLLIDNLLDDGFDRRSIKTLLENAESRSPLKRRWARKTLASHLREKKEKDSIDTILSLLRTYQESEEELTAKKGLYSRIYGENVNTMNGTIELETNIDYVHLFHERGKKDEGFSMDNPLVKKCFKDKNFYRELLERYQDVEKDYLRIRSDVNLYIGFFLDDRKDYLDVDFQELLALFDTRLTGTFEEFHEYAIFHQEEEKCSMILRLALRRELASSDSLADFPYLFVGSLIAHLYERGRKTFLSFRKEYEEKKKSFLKGVEEHNFYLDERLHENFLQGQKDLLASSTFQDDFQRLEVSYRKNDWNDFQEAIRLLSHIRPVFVLSEDDLKKVKKDTFDVILLFDSSKFSDIALIRILLIGKEIFFLNRNASNDPRTLGYRETRLDKKTLYYDFYDKAIDPDILKRIQDILLPMGYHLDKGKDFPLILQKEENHYALLADLMIPSGFEKASLIDLREYLYVTHELKVVDIDIIHFLIDAQEELREALLED